MTEAATTTDDLRISKIRPLDPPAGLIGRLPVSEQAAELVSKARKDAEMILAGRDDRLLAIVGPCSIHDEKAALEYGELLSKAARRHEKDLHLLMRVYFEKPRTTVGWKGYVNDPALDGTCEINEGLGLARQLLLELAARGIPAGTEFLDTITPQYIADLVAWGAIGARTTESQIHRQLASGLSMPVGFKNGTDGNIEIARDAIGAAVGSHHFLSVTKEGVAAIVTTSGNPSCHVILRGASSGPNHHAEAVQQVLGQLRASDLPPYLMVDCSHGNSLKDHDRQPLVAREVAAQVASGETGIAGVMIESHLVAGAQKIATPDCLVYGQSITDACVDWATTEGMLEGLADAVRSRRALNRDQIDDC